MKKKTIRNILLFVGIPLAVIGMIYLFVSFYYMDRFYNGTWINGVNFSHKTVKEAQDSLIEYKSSYNIRLVEVDGDQEVVKGSDIDYAVTFDKVADIKAEQGMWHWLQSFMDVNFYTVENSISYNKEVLKEVVDKLDCVSGKGVIAPSDAYVEFTEAGVNLVPEVTGTMVDKDKLYDALIIALDKGDRRLYLDSADLYVAPKITTQSREIREIMAPVEKITKTTITYTFGDDTEVLDENTTKEWICKDEEGNVTVNADKVTAFVQSLADKYNTWGGSRQFVTSGGQTITVGGGNYGWSLDVAKETEALTELLKNGRSETREPIYNATAVRRGGNEIGDTYIEISISQQHMWFYKNGSLYVDTAIVTGNTSDGFDTPKGSYKVLNKFTDITLEGDNKDGSKYASPVTYWLGFKGRGYGIHDASWRGDNQGNYGGNIYVYGGSHGCVNTPFSKVQAIFNAVEINTPVLVY